MREWINEEQPISVGLYQTIGGREMMLSQLGGLGAVDLVIFDCDGVLVDSEVISVRVLTAAARLEGADLGFDEALRLFRGRRFSECVAEIERRSGRAVPEDFVSRVRNDTAVVFASELKPIPGVRSALARIRAQTCVASNGPMFKLEQTLRLTRLHRFFAGRVFSAYDVGSWKPDPGLFLYAAAQFNVPPSRCVVIEDSVTGVLAAKAGGMRVLGYASVCAHAADLRSVGADVFSDMQELAGRLGF